MTANPNDELFERARRTIRELREKLAAAEERNRLEPIAVIGMGIDFPGSGRELSKFWEMIAEGRDAVTPIPAKRWDRDSLYAPGAGVPGKINTRHAAFLEDVERFDAAFFDITPREAAHMDPQQRIFLETAWNALENAGVPKANVAGKDAGIFVGVHNHSADYQAMQFQSPASLDAYSATGTAHDMIGGRLAYWLNLHGPAITVNSACSSSLVAVHLACQSLRSGDCTLALAGGLNLLLGPGFTIAAAQLQLLSPDGRCKPFDARADGMGRGEGCGVVILKKLSAARRDGDRVLAVIRGSAVNQDGKTNGLTAPNGLAQQQVLKRALENASVEPWEIGYVEAHGTGTALGDPIEVEALAEVLGEIRRTEPCTLGAVKANIGHLEGAAGIAGLIKAILVLRHRWLPPVANLQQLNPHLAFEETSLTIPRQGREWKTNGRRLAGVSSFGWSGTNAHVVLEEAPAASTSSTLGQTFPLLISAQSPQALRLLAKAYADHLEHADTAELGDICYTAALRKTPHTYRIAVSGSEPKEVALVLRRRASEWTAPSSPKAQVENLKPAEAESLDSAMHAWETGASIDWSFAFPVPGSVVDLPLYPFEGTRYWLDSPAWYAVVGSQPDLATSWLYSTVWEVASDPVNSTAELATWLIFPSGAPLAASLAEAARSQGDRVIELQHEEHAIREAMHKLAAGSGPAYALYLIGGQTAAQTIAAALGAAQSILRSGRAIRLSFVVEGAQLLDGAEVDLLMPSAVIRGFSRVLGLEHPEIWGGLIDADNYSLNSANAILHAVRQSAGEDRIALRGSVRKVARLQRQNIAAGLPALELKADRSYLVTGAFGRLGMEIASWLVGCGARSLILVGRRDPAQMDNPALLLQLEAMRQRGITVIAEACDVSSESEVSRLLDTIRDSGRKLAGVIHAAAAIPFSAIADAPRQDIELALHAKLDGARVLDRCTRNCELDFFVLFGSAAATIGIRNGALYAAANSGLDAITQARRAVGLPALTVEWGAWDDGRTEMQAELVKQSGFVAMAPRKALCLLGTLLVSQAASSIESALGSVLIADIGWKTLGPALESRGKHLFTSGLTVSSGEPAGEQDLGIPVAESQTQRQWLDSLRPLPADERKYRLLGFVGAEVRAVFGMAPGDPVDETRGLFQLGMDSLMSVKLRRRLEAGTALRLPGTLTFTYPTITAIADFLEERLFPSHLAEPVIKVPSRLKEPDAAPVDQVNEVDAMDDAETSAAIAAELAAIRQKLGVLADG
jgi:acyl transferase domain-containing protein/acyl carrier protein